jgi:hypothetical protein
VTLTKVEYRARYRAKKLAEDTEYFKKQHKAYLAKNRDKVNALQRAGYQRNRLKRLAKNKQWRENHPEYMAEWKKKHPGYHAEVSNKWRTNNREHWATYVTDWANQHPEIIKADYIANHGIGDYDPVPLAEFCEVCPEDDLRKATDRHHPDYNYPRIIVSCCGQCHKYMNNERDNKLTESK